MRSLRFLLMSAIFSIWLSGCASNSINIDSVPREAKIRATVIDDGSTIDLGETPYSIQDGALPEPLKGKAVRLEFAKKGYVTREILIQRLDGFELNLKQTLEEEGKGANYRWKDEDVTNYVTRILDIQKAARSQRLRPALEGIKDVKKSYPDLGVTYEIEGSIYFLAKDYKSALGSFEKAFKLDPNSKTIPKMIKVLKAKGVN